MIHASTLDEYLQLPLAEREVQRWFWPFKWYRKPYAMAWMKSSKGEWEKFEDYVKFVYPVQHFMRDTVYWFFYSLKYDIRSIRYKIQHKIINPRREMIKKVFPPQYQDLDFHIVTFCLECVIEYVDREEALKEIDWTTSDEHKAFAAELKEVYDYAKTGKGKLQAELDTMWDVLKVDDTKTYDQNYGHINKKEEELKEYDTRVCEWVVRNRDRLWT
jgi:RNAse (barnase) inhibitor barstar